MRLKKRTLVLLGAAVVAIGLAVGAYAYFSASGSGTGSASVGTATAIAISATTDDGNPLTDDNNYPDGPAKDVAITLTNNGSGAQHVTDVSLNSIDPVSGCDVSLNSAGSAFTFANPVAVNADLAAGASTTVHGSLQMNDTGVPQDGCQGKALTLNFTSTP